jgi:hypothetical protein
VLRLGGAEVKISFLELFDNNIGPRGANALGMALSFGHNLSLLTLKLDYNPTLGDEGVINLCKGLRTNSTLKQLHIQFCNVSSKSGSALAEFLANSKSAVEVFNMSGNRLGGDGLAKMCGGLMYNTKCETLCIADNMIDQVVLSKPYLRLKYLIPRRACRVDGGRSAGACCVKRLST